MNDYVVYFSRFIPAAVALAGATLAYSRLDKVKSSDGEIGYAIIMTVSLIAAVGTAAAGAFAK